MPLPLHSAWGQLVELVELGAAPARVLRFTQLYHPLHTRCRRFVESEPDIKRVVPRPGDLFVVLARWVVTGVGVGINHSQWAAAVAHLTSGS